MILFYTPDISDDFFTLNEEESRHCRTVLRLTQGDSIYLTDGKGTLYQAQIIDAQSRRVIVEVTQKTEEYGKRNYRVHMAVAPTKNIERFEWFLEKATEIGVDEITPLLCEHSERKQIRPDRLEKVITSAVKQSLKAYHPVINDLADFRKFVNQNLNGQRFLAHLEEENPILLKNACIPGEDVTILIGPEGDFSPSELVMAGNQNWKTVSLGSSRLRTETAAIAACHTVYFINL